MLASVCQWHAEVKGIGMDWEKVTLETWNCDYAGKVGHSSSYSTACLTLQAVTFVTIYNKCYNFYFILWQHKKFNSWRGTESGGGDQWSVTRVVRVTRCTQTKAKIIATIINIKN